jgi:hypothetical protein
MTMAAQTPEQKATQAQLKEIFKRMDGHQAQEIREAYYKAMDGLRALSEALEIADARQPQAAGPLLGEHLYVAQALDAMRPSQLGVIL